MKHFDDDMDELFNKAGRDYPLKTDPKNWDRVRGALLDETTPADVVQTRKGWRRLLPLLLLLIIPAVYIFLDKNNTSKQNNADTSYNADKTPTAADNSQHAITSSSEPAVKEKISNKSEKSVKAPELSTSPVTNEQIERTNNLSDREVNRLSYVPPAKQSLVKRNRSEGSLKVKGGLSGPPKAGLSNKRDFADEQINTRETEINDELNAWIKFPMLNVSLKDLSEPSDVIPMQAPLGSLNQSKESVPNSVKKTRNKSGLYYGVIAAPDITTIKGQAVKGVGYSAGIIIGYTFNQRWQLDAAVMWSRKKYFTDGKYFGKEKAQIPANVTLNWLDGGCEMFEFPIAVKYDLSAKKNTFFAGAGLTSYIMKKEDYNFSAVYGAGGYDYEGYRSYKRSGDHLFANVQLSAGYKYSLSSKLNIRLEPYLKIPLKKIGIGELPITSTGLYFSLMRDLR
jgi:hypothetical protein